jgi:hypothetical protein
MKTIIIILLSSLIWVGINCKSDNEKLLDSISGTWQVYKIVYKNLSNKPDSTINCTNCVLQIDNCTLGNGGCGGYYKLMDGQKVNITQSPYGKAQELSISIVGEPANPLYLLIGKYTIENLSGTSMTLVGQFTYKTANGIQQVDAEIQMKK